MTIKSIAHISRKGKKIVVTIEGKNVVVSTEGRFGSSTSDSKTLPPKQWIIDRINERVDQFEAEEVNEDSLSQLVQDAISESKGSPPPGP